MRATVNQIECIGCSLCPDTCPEVFKMDGDKAVVYKNPVPEEVEDKCRDAANECPVAAIEIEE